jgi:threonylcarbamoyladenosine tRNA methylthiotransferase MtaB
MPQLAPEVVKARAARIRAAASKRRSRWLDSLVGNVQPVLIEGDGIGHTDSFAPVAVPDARRGQAGKVKITARDGDRLVGAWA